MNQGLFRLGHQLFEAFGVSLESEIIFMDSCHDLVWLYHGGIRFTQDALLISDLREGQDDWTQAGDVRFYPWHNVFGIRNVKRNTVLQEYERQDVEEWLRSLEWPSVDYPYLHAAPAQVSLMLKGAPRSVRSKGGKARLRADAEEQREAIKAGFGHPLLGPVEMAIDVFSSEPVALPDVDRFSNSIMDAFQGIAYEDDKQVRHLRPRVHEVAPAFQQLECTSEPMVHFSIDDIPPGALYPLCSGVRDYYVIRIQPNG